MGSGKNSLLWQIERSDWPGKSYLFGTMHTRSARVHRLVDCVTPFLEACTAFAAEFNPEEHTSAPVGDLRLPAGQSLRDLLGEKHFQKARRILKKTVQFDLARMEDWHPVVVQSTLDGLFFSREHAYPLDVVLWQRAQTMGKIGLGLETSEAQLKLLQTMSPEEGARQLLEMTRRIRAHRRHMQRLMTLYLEGDPDRLYQHARRGLGAYRKTFLYARNRTMAEGILAFSQSYPLFAAVGAGHLSGGKGILRLLKHQGCRVRPIDLLAITPSA